MAFKHPATGGREFRELGRLSSDDVVQTLVDAYRKVDPSAIKEDGSHIKTVGDLLRAWFYWQEQRGPESSARPENQIAERTLIAYRTCARQILDLGEEIPLRNLSKQDLLSLRDRMAEVYAPRTVNANIKALRQAVLWGQERGVQVPTLNWRTLRLRVNGYTNRHRTPTHEEVAKVYGSMRRCGLKLSLFIAWKTGARIGEVSDLTWADIWEDADGAWVTLTGKTGSRRFPLTTGEVREIRSYQSEGARDEDRLFSRHNYKNASGQLVESCKLRGVEPFTMHGLRRLMTDTCLRRGVDIGCYAVLLGHSPAEALKAYRQPTVDDLRGALVKIRSKAQEGILPFLARRGLTEEEAIALLGNVLEGAEEVEGTELRVLKGSSRAGGA